MNTKSKLARAGAAATAAATILASVASPLSVLASSHREAPLISADRNADATDLYAFVSPERPDSVTLIANYNPFQEPAGGPNFYGFGDDVLYEIKVDNTGDAKADITYQFKFTNKLKNGETFLYNTGAVNSLNDANLNVSQTYTLTKIEGGQTTVLGTDLPVPPANVGPKSTGKSAELMSAAVQSLSGSNGATKAFAGPVDDPFFVDLGGIFDLLTIRKLPGNAGGGVDGLAGYNVSTLALQVPIKDLTASKQMPTGMTDANAVIGVWTTASRRTTRVLSADGTKSDTGEYVQVSRLGAPLVNEVVLPLSKKDRWNGSKLVDDGQFANYVTDPELAKLFTALYGIKVPPQGTFGSASQRDDLIAIFLTGIKGLNQPANVVPSEQLRLNVAVAPSAKPNSLGVAGGDNAGFPNGRRLADDVTDIALKAVAGALYPVFHPEFKADPVAGQLGDGVDKNDVSFSANFPYQAVPHSGYWSNPHVPQAFLDAVNALFGALAGVLGSK